MEPNNELESQLAALYHVYSVKKERKQSERLTLKLLELYLELDPPMVWGRSFDDDLQSSPAVRKAVAAARKRVPKRK